MVSTTIRNLRLSKMSASAPAGIANREIGRLLAACTSATINASGLSEVINQPDAALYIQPPTLETSVAVQRTVKAEWRNGAANVWDVPPYRRQRRSSARFVRERS